MQDLHRDLAARVMHAVRDDAVVGDVFCAEHHRRAGQHAAFGVGAIPPVTISADTAARACGVELGHPVPVPGLFQPGVHRPHQHAVLQRGEAQIERAPEDVDNGT